MADFKMKSTFAKLISQYRYNLKGLIRLEKDNVKTLRSIKRRKDEKPSVMVMVYSVFGGGAERVATKIASGLCRDYHVILLYLQEKESAYPVNEEVEKIVMPNFYVASERYWELAERIFIYRLKRIRKVRLSVSFMYRMNLLNIQTKRKEKTVCCERNNPAKREPENMQEIRKIYRKSDHVVFQTETVRELFDQQTKAHSSILPNPVSVPVLADREPARKIVTIGRLNRQKDQQTLLRAFALFLGTHEAYTLELYGQGELREELESLAQELGIGENVRFMGMCEDVHEKIRDAEMFVLPSLYEGFSNVLLECMMMGIPCISTDCEGSAEVLRDGWNGLVVPKRDPKAMCGAMIRLSQDRKLRETIRKNAKETALAYEEQKAVAQWVARLKEVMGE